MSDLKITVAGTEQTVTRQGPMNPTSQFGQSGSIFNDGTGAIAPPDGMAIVAITFLADTTFDTSGGTEGMVAEDPDKYANTATAAHNLADGSESSLEGSGGLVVDASNTFPKGVTIYGRWTSLNLASGMVIAYLG